MRVKTQNTGKRIHPSKHLIEDFLEIKTQLSAAERAALIERIGAESIQPENIQTQPALWMNGRVLLVLKEQPAECWFYYALSGKMEKVRLNGIPSAFGKIAGIIP